MASSISFIAYVVVSVSLSNSVGEHFFINSDLRISPYAVQRVNEERMREPSEIGPAPHRQGKNATMLHSASVWKADGAERANKLWRV